MNKSVLLIGNKGRFLEKVKNRLLVYNLTCITCDEFNFEILSSKHQYDLVLYVGGEVRNVEKMKLLNFELPSILLNYCKEKNIRIIYLSSLSVFGFPKKDRVNLNSERLPYDEYGNTKNMFDELVRLNKGVQASILYPASIISGKGRSSVEKFNSLKENHKFFRYFSFSGCLSYIQQDVLIEEILTSINSNHVGEKILSNHMVLNDDRTIAIPKIPLRIYHLLSFIIGTKRSMLLRVINRGIYYG